MSNKARRACRGASSLRCPVLSSAGPDDSADAARARRRGHWI